jgi:hypothetical protein
MDEIGSGSVRASFKKSGAIKSEGDNAVSAKALRSPDVRRSLRGR